MNCSWHQTTPLHTPRLHKCAPQHALPLCKSNQHPTCKQTSLLKTYTDNNRRLLTLPWPSAHPLPAHCNLQSPGPHTPLPPRAARSITSSAWLAAHEAELATLCSAHMHTLNMPPKQLACSHLAHGLEHAHHHLLAIGKVRLDLLRQLISLIGALGQSQVLAGVTVLSHEGDLRGCRRAPVCEQ